MRPWAIKLLGVLLVSSVFAQMAAAKVWEVNRWSYNNWWLRENSFVWAIDNAANGDVVVLTKQLTVDADISVYKDVTVRSSAGKKFKIRNVGNYFICNIHPGAKLTLSNVVVDCESVSRREDLFRLHAYEVDGSVTNIARMVLASGAEIKNVKLTSSSDSENAAIHIKKGGVLRIQEGSLIENCDNQSVPGKGGAICCDFGTVIMTGGTITRCRAKSAGGAIHSDGTRLESVDLEGITARGDIYLSGGYITNNYCGAGFNGGAIYLGNSGPMLRITGSIVVSNNFSGAIADDISTFELKNEFANRLKLTGHSDVNPSGFTTNGITFTGWVGVRYPLNEQEDPEGARFGGEWEYFARTQEEPRQFFWNGDNTYRGRLNGNSLVWSKHLVHELPKDGLKISELVASGEGSPLYIELNADYEMRNYVDVPENYRIIIDLQGHDFKCKLHVHNTSSTVEIRDSSLMKSGTVSGERESTSPTAFLLSGGSYQTYPPPNWIAPDKVLVRNYCEHHPYMVASLAWQTNAMSTLSDLTAVPLSQVDNEVRVVESAEDIGNITFSAGDWVNLEYTNSSYKVQVFVVAAVSNVTDATISEVGEPVLLFDSDSGLSTSDSISSPGGNENGYDEISFGREDMFKWNALSYGLIKMIHVTLRAEGERYVTNDVEYTYFRFPEAEFLARQRKTNGELPIILRDELLQMFSVNRADGFAEDFVNRHLNEYCANGLRKWENIVTGTDDGQLLLSTLTQGDGGFNLNIALADAGKLPRNNTGYSTWYDIRKSGAGGWERIGEVSSTPNFVLPLLDQEGRSTGASGFYRITTLIVPDNEHSITNEIPSTNIVGVLEIAGKLTNTLAAVPWVALPSGLEHNDNAGVTVSNYMHTANRDDNDALQVADGQGLYRRWHWNKHGKKWEGALTVTREALFSAEDASQHRLERGGTAWIIRNDPDAKPIFLVGQYSGNPLSITIAAGGEDSSVSTLVPNPSLEPVPVNAYNWGLNPVEGDVIRIPNEKKAPLLLTWNGKEWGWIARIPGSRNGYWKTDDCVPAGTGFWYRRSPSAGSFEVSLPQSSPAAQ